MQKIMLLALACGLLACSDDKTSGASKADAGGDDTNEASVAPEDDASASTEASGLERAPGGLARPPGKKLPDDLKPPGFAK